MREEVRPDYREEGGKEGGLEKMAVDKVVEIPVLLKRFIISKSKYVYYPKWRKSTKY